MNKIVKKKNSLWPIGNCKKKVNEYDISLPSQHDILSHFLCLHLNEKKLINESAREIAVKVLAIRKRKNINCIEEYNISENLKKIYENWLSLKKIKSSTSDYQVRKRVEFIDKLSCRFDVVRHNVVHPSTKKKNCA